MISFLTGFLRDPNSCDGSMARLCALLCTLGAIACVLKFPPTGATAGIVGAFVGGGAVALLLRAQTENPSEEGKHD